MPAEMTLDEFFADVGTPRIAGRKAASRSSETQRERKQSGDRAEGLVELLHKQCEIDRVAWVRKLPTEVKVRRKGKQIVGAKHVAKAGCDYVGMMRGGRHVVVEVKRCTTKRFSLARVEPHQREDLDRVLANDGVAVLLVVYGPHSTAHAVPWVECVGRATIGPEDLVPHQVKPGEAYLARWLPIKPGFERWAR
jgi:penicillin-binding protein-related factor A (putative recombinase)